MAYEEHDGSEHFGARSSRLDHDDPVMSDAAHDADPTPAGEAGLSPVEDWFGGDDYDSGPIAPPPPYAQPQAAAPAPAYPPSSAPPPPQPQVRPAAPTEPEPEPDSDPEPSNVTPLSSLSRNRPQIRRLLQDPQRPAPKPVTDDVPEPEPLPPLDFSDAETYRSSPNTPTSWKPEPPSSPASSEVPAAEPRPQPERPRPPVPTQDARTASDWGGPRMASPLFSTPEQSPPPTAPPPTSGQPPENRAPLSGSAPFGHTPPGGAVAPETTGFDPRGADAQQTSQTFGGAHGRRQPPTGGWRRALHSVTFGLVHPGESPAELRRRELTDRARTYVVGGHHRVAVLSLKGGVGKTTTAVALGSTLASLRGDRVLAVDANPDRGTLSDKLRLETAATIRDLLNEKEMISRYADIRGFTSQASSRLEVLASDRDPAVSEAFSEYDYREVARILEHFYSITLTDCGTGLLHSAMRGVLGLADQIVVVSTPSVDGARSASATLDWLEAHEYGYLVRGAVVVLSMVRQGGKSSVDLRRLEDHFNSRCRAVVQIPWDSHLEEGAEVHLDQLHSTTRDAYLELAATVGEAFAWPR